GAEVGGDVTTGPATTSDALKDPVKAAYNMNGSPTSGAWGQAALLYAVRGGIGTTFSIGGYNGQTAIDPSTSQFPGYSVWSQTPSVGHSYVDKQISASDMAAIINPLIQSSSNMPILTSITPTSVPAGSSGQTVTVAG